MMHAHVVQGIVGIPVVGVRRFDLVEERNDQWLHARYVGADDNHILIETVGVRDAFWIGCVL